MSVYIFMLISLKIHSQNKKENDSIIETYGELNVLYDYDNINTKSGHIPLGFVDKGIDAYNKFKDSLSSKTGLNFSIEYAPIQQWDFAGKSRAHLSDELNLIGQFNIIDKTNPGSGNVVIWYQYASTHTTSTTTAFMTDLGIITPINGGDTFPNRSNSKFVHMAYEQRFFDNKLRFMLGKLSSRVFLNLNRYGVSDRQDFLNFMFVNNPVVPFIARQGLGVFMQYDFGEWYISGMFRDATAMSDFFDLVSLSDNTWEYATEIAYTPKDLAGLGSGNYRATIHYTDATSSGLQHMSGYTFSFSFDQDLGSKFGAMMRYSYATENFLAFRQRFAIGAQLLTPFNFQNDRLGVGFWWGEHVDPSVGSEYGLEAFYKFQFARFMEVSPDLQLVLNPALDPNKNAVLIGGIRLRIVL